MAKAMKSLPPPASPHTAMESAAQDAFNEKPDRDFPAGTRVQLISGHRIGIVKFTTPHGVTVDWDDGHRTTQPSQFLDHAVL